MAARISKALNFSCFFLVLVFSCFRDKSFFPVYPGSLLVILKNRRAFSVVSNMAYLFDQLGVPATLHYGVGMLNARGAIFPGDVVFAVTFAPFSPEVVRLVEAAAGQGVTVFGLTDSERCPVAEWATEMLIVREDEVAGFRAPTAAITLTTALAVAVSAVQRQS